MFKQARFRESFVGMAHRYGCVQVVLYWVFLTAPSLSFSNAEVFDPSRPAHSECRAPLAGLFKEFVFPGQTDGDFLEELKYIAHHDEPVLIIAESGTGKTFVARFLHLWGKRGLGPWVPVQIGATTETLLEDRLFGHNKGAFTGAITRHRGLFEVANTGVLFLDEIGDLNAQAQAAILGAVEEKQFRAVGENTIIKSDVRVISATNQDLREAIRERRFRDDLFCRLKGHCVRLLPLREKTGRHLAVGSGVFI